MSEVDASAVAVVVVSPGCSPPESGEEWAEPPSGVGRPAGVAETGRATRSARRACQELGVDLDALLAGQSMTGEAGGVLVVPLARAQPPSRLLVVGVGAGEPADWRAAGAALARRAGGGGRLAVVADPPPSGLRAFAEGLALASYRPSGTVTPGRPASPVAAFDDVVIVTDRADSAAHRAVASADVVARAVCLARDLANTPSLVKSPGWFAERAVEAAETAGLTASVLGARELAEGGFGGMCAVGAGSPRPPCLVQLSYSGPADPAAVESGPIGRAGHRVLVGKGITFDSGGLSLKPPGSMVGMKTDMSGAAAVLATMTALPALGVPGRVTGLLCLAENMIGAAAMRPGDVITCWGGTTVEVLNTDAEGRLVLADGLAYAAAVLRPDVLVDLATLTGAVTVALGRRTAGLFASDDGLAAALTAAAESAGERLWRLPLVEEYRAAIASPVADLANIGRALDVSGGSITAAMFLREFTGGLPWAHLDIAGTARSDTDDGDVSRGGTGWGVRTLLAWLLTVRS
jgi:leucyl aminopeptidase